MKNKLISYPYKIVYVQNISPLIINIFLIALINLFLFPVLSNAYSYMPDSLTVRNAHVMAYDEVNKVVLLFGGADERQVLNDLWTWNGKEWNCVSTGGGPSPRTFSALAYDSARKQLILFGGNRVLFGTEQDTSTFLDDMWGWYDQKWHQIKTKTPSTRAEASMAYDANRKCLVLFGGYRNEKGERIRLGDTWEWNGNKWEEKSTEVSPPPRNGTAMVYDSHRKKIVLFGGSGGADDTWEWDGIHWQKITQSDDEKRFNSTMAYNEKQDCVIRFGGWTREGRVGDTWKYDGIKWTKLSDEGPEPRNHSSMVYDKRRGVLVLFGGHDGERVFGDTWEWNGNKWILRMENPPRLRINNGH